MASCTKFVSHDGIVARRIQINFMWRINLQHQNARNRFFTTNSIANSSNSTMLITFINTETITTSTNCGQFSRSFQIKRQMIDKLLHVHEKKIVCSAETHCIHPHCLWMNMCVLVHCALLLLLFAKFNAKLGKGYKLAMSQSSRQLFLGVGRNHIVLIHSCSTRYHTIR